MVAAGLGRASPVGDSTGGGTCVLVAADEAVGIGLAVDVGVTAGVRSVAGAVAGHVALAITDVASARASGTADPAVEFWPVSALERSAAHTPMLQTATTAPARIMIVARSVLLTGLFPVCHRGRPHPAVRPEQANHSLPTASAVTWPLCARAGDGFAGQQPGLHRSQVGALVWCVTTRPAGRRHIGRFHWRE